MAKKLEEQILDLLNSDSLNEAVEYEVIGGPTPSQTLSGPLDYAKNIQKATVPQATKIPGVGEIGSDVADENDDIDVIIGEDEEEYDEKDSKKKDDDDDEDEDKEDLEETYASLLARLAEDEDDAPAKSSPKETLPDVDSELDSPEKLVTKAPGIQVAEDELSEGGPGSGRTASTHHDYGKVLSNHGWKNVEDNDDEAVYKHSKKPGRTIVVSKDGGSSSWVHSTTGGKIKGSGNSSNKLHFHLKDEANKKVTNGPAAKALRAGVNEDETPKETLPDVDSELENPEKLVTPAPGAKKPDQAQDVSEDVDAIFSGTELSESARQRATVIFQAAVTRKVNEEKTRVREVATKKLQEAYGQLKTKAEKKQDLFESTLTEQVDRYLNYVVENWMKENRLAVERGIRAELAESFITGLKSLFVEHYIEVPETKVDVVATLGKKVTTLESKLNESIEMNTKMKNSLNIYRKEEVVRAVSAGLADTQREKLLGLSEGVEYTTRKEFAKKMTELKESYFPKKTTTLKKDESPLITESAPKPVRKVTDDLLEDSEMALYTNTLKKIYKRD